MIMTKRLCVEYRMLFKTAIAIPGLLGRWSSLWWHFRLCSSVARSRHCQIGFAFGSGGWPQLSHIFRSRVVAMYRTSSRYRSEIGDFLTFDGHREQNTGRQSRKNFISFLRSLNIQCKDLPQAWKNICLRKEGISSFPSEMKKRKLISEGGFFRLSVSRTSKINVKFSTTEKFVKTET